MSVRPHDTMDTMDAVHIEDEDAALPPPDRRPKISRLSTLQDLDAAAPNQKQSAKPNGSPASPPAKAGGWAVGKKKVIATNKTVAAVEVFTRTSGLMKRLASMAAPKMMADDVYDLMDSQNTKRVLKVEQTIDQLKKRMVKKEKLISCVFYFTFMLTFIGISIAQRNITDSYKMEYVLSTQIKGLKDVNGNLYSDVSDFGGIFDWIQTGLLPQIFPKQEWYNGDLYNEFEKNYFLEYNRIVGGVKLIQRRVDPQLCDKTDNTVVDWYHEHYGDASSGAKCSAHFDQYYPVLFPNLDLSTASALAYGPAQDHEKYNWEKDSYGGGFFVFTGTESTTVYKLMEELRRDKWLDKSSRALEVTFTVYNGNYQLFTSITLQFKMFATGLIEKDFRMGTFRVEGYSTTADFVRLAVELLLGLYIFCTAAAELRDAVCGEAGSASRLEGGRLTPGKVAGNIHEHLSSAWNWIDAVRLSLSVAVVVGWLMISISPIATNLTLPLPPNTPFYDFEPLVQAHKLQTQLVALTVATCLISFFKFAHYSDKYGMIIRTITRAGPDLLQFLIMFFIIFVIFAVMGMMMFGTSLEEWSAFTSAFQTLIMMLTVEYGMEGLIEVDPISGTLFYSMFLMLGYFLLVNILLAILIDAYTSLGTELSDASSKDTVNMGIVEEMVATLRLRLYIGVHGGTGEKAAKLEDTLMTTPKMITILSQPEIKKGAVVMRGERTIHNPHPEDEHLVTYTMLKSMLPLGQARLIMAAVGVVWEDNAVFDEEFASFSPQRLKESASVADTAALETKVASLCEALSQRDKKLDRLLALLEAKAGLSTAPQHPFGMA